MTELPTAGDKSYVSANLL